jgi:hypothetical protein
MRVQASCVGAERDVKQPLDDDTTAHKRTAMNLPSCRPKHARAPRPHAHTHACAPVKEMSVWPSMEILLSSYRQMSLPRPQWPAREAASLEMP